MITEEEKLKVQQLVGSLTNASGGCNSAIVLCAVGNFMGLVFNQLLNSNDNDPEMVKGAYQEWRIFLDECIQLEFDKKNNAV